MRRRRLSWMEVTGARAGWSGVVRNLLVSGAPITGLETASGNNVLLLRLFLELTSAGVCRLAGLRTTDLPPRSSSLQFRGASRWWE